MVKATEEEAEILLRMCFLCAGCLLLLAACVMMLRRLCACDSRLWGMSVVFSHNLC